jgi:GGDEF domain-containing protein
VIALSDCDIETATAICERLRESLVLAYQTGEAPPVTASFGIALWNRHEPLEQTIAHADLALYRAKRDGRNRAAIYEPEGADAS